MIKVDHIEVWGFEHAIRGMRNPMSSWDRSDSTGEKVGKADLELMRSLYRAGTEHRKYLRQIFVSMDITAPLYWWKEADQYRIGVTTNSCSTMHTITKTEIGESLFSIDDGIKTSIVLACYIALLEELRQEAISGNKDSWRQLIQLLPCGFNQRRTITMSYENVVSIIKQRTGHKLDEWNDFCEVLKGLPYIKEIMGE